MATQTIFDWRDPNPAVLNWALNHFGAPENVKQAAAGPVNSTDHLADVAFAMPVLRRYPLHTKEATWLSSAHFTASNRQNPLAWAAIKRAADLFGIGAEVQAMPAKYREALTKSAQATAPETKFAMVFEHEGRTLNLLPMHDEGSVLASAWELHQTLQDPFATIQAPASQVKLACERLVDRAREIGMSEALLPAPIVARGERRLHDNDVALELIELRKSAGASEEDMVLYRDCVKAAADAAPEEFPQLVQALWDLDRDLGVRYGPGQPDPDSLMFRGASLRDLEKAAAHVVFLAGVPVPIGALSSLKEPAIRAAFSKEAADLLLGVRSAAEVDAQEVRDSVMTAVRDLSNSEQERLLALLV